MAAMAPRKDYLTFPAAISNTTAQSVRLDELPVSLAESGPSTTVAATGKPGQFVVIQVAVLCNDAAVFYKDGQFQRTGEPTEAALKVLAEKLGEVIPGVLHGEQHTSGFLKPEEACRRATLTVSSKWRRIATLEFNRDRKSMSVLVRPKLKQPVRSVRL